MSVKEPMRVLMQAQLDADIVPADVLACGASVTDGKLRINREGYGCLIVPWARRLPRAVAATLRSHRHRSDLQTWNSCSFPARREPDRRGAIKTDVLD
jgi:hypothetical protein